MLGAILTDPEWLFYGAAVGIPIGIALFGFMELIEPDSPWGEFWEAFKDEARD